MTHPPAPGIESGITTVVYDFGNVLVHWDPRGAFAGLDAAEVDAFFAGFDFLAFNHLMDAGTLPFVQARAEVAARTPQWVPFLDRYLANYPGTMAAGPVAGSAELVDELHGLGLRLYGLTNWWAETFHHATALAPAIGRMDGVVVSGRVGLAKPDPAIFETLVETFGIDPWRAVFVDDALPNVEAARSVGFHAVHFTTTAALRAALRALGVPVTAARDDAAAADPPGET